MDWKWKYGLIALGIAIFFGLILWWCFSGKKTKNSQSPSSSQKVYIPREGTDKRMRQLSTSIKGNSKTPIYIIENFLTPEECKKIIETAHGKMSRSPLTRPGMDKDFRTSETCFFDGTGIQNDIERKICKTIGLPSELSEDSQIQHYRTGNQFKTHMDYFHAGLDEAFLKDGQRTWTFMVYLNQVPRGGFTEFVDLKETIPAKPGTAVVWCNLKSNREPDDKTRHRGTPVDQGEKWIITKWFRDQRQK